MVCVRDGDGDGVQDPFAIGFASVGINSDNVESSEVDPCSRGDGCDDGCDTRDGDVEGRLKCKGLFRFELGGRDLVEAVVYAGDGCLWRSDIAGFDSISDNTDGVFEVVAGVEEYEGKDLFGVDVDVKIEDPTDLDGE